MTVADQPGSRTYDSGEPRPRAAGGELKGAGGVGGTRGRNQKPMANVVDFLAMNTIHDAPSSLPAVGSIDDLPQPEGGIGGDGGDVLDALVQDHLKRTTTSVPFSYPVPPPVPPPFDTVHDPVMPRSLPSPAAGNGSEDVEAGAEEDGPGMLQREIDALLGRVPGGEAEAVEGSEGVGDGAGYGEMEERPALSAEEVNVLLSGCAEGNAGAGAAELAGEMGYESRGGGAGVEAGSLEDESAAKILEAEGVLEQELAELMAQGSGGASRGASEGASGVGAEMGQTEAAVVVDEGTAVPVVESGGVAAVLAAVPKVVDVGGAGVGVAETEAMVVPAGVPEHPIVELLDRTRGGEEVVAEKARGRVMTVFGEVALVAAQIVDIPFQWMDVLDKNLLGVAALVLLLSGIALKVAAWWMGV